MMIAAGAALVGDGIQVVGDITSANDQAQLDQERAAIAQQQSNEIASREANNEALKEQQAYRQKLQFGSSYAASGKAGSGVGSQLQIQLQADTANAISGREASFQEQMLQTQAGIDTTLAGQSQTSGVINAIGAGVGGIARAGSIATSGGNNPGYGGTAALPPMPDLSASYQIPTLGSGRFGGG
jgi:hypothetical protein